MIKGRLPRVVLVQAPIFEWSTPSNALALICAHLKRAGLSPMIYDASTGLRTKLGRALRLDFGLREDLVVAREELIQAAADHPDLTARFLAEEVANVLKLEPDFVGFSVLTGTETWSLEMASQLKRANPRLRVIFGGSQCLREIMGPEFIQHPAVDVVVLGEADRSAPRVMLELDPDHNPLPSVPGVLVKHEGRIVDGGEPEELEELDELPYLDFSGFDMSAYTKDRLFMSTSRGCVRKCSFCTHIVQQKFYRTMTAKRAVAEIRHHLAQYPDRCYVDFNDSLINGNVRRLGEMSDLLKELRTERLISHPGSDFGWTGMAILHPTMTFELLKKMRLGGCRSLRYGLESGSQKVVDLMKKNFRLSEAVEVIKNTRKAGIGAHLYILVGFPGETEADFQETLDFIERHADCITGASASFCEIQKGSHMDLHSEEYDIKQPVGDPTYWQSRDGSNTYAVRQERAKRVERLVERLGLHSRVHSSKVGEFTSVPARAAS